MSLISLSQLFLIQDNLFKDIFIRNLPFLAGYTRKYAFIFRKVIQVTFLE